MILVHSFIYWRCPESNLTMEYAMDIKWLIGVYVIGVLLSILRFRTTKMLPSIGRRLLILGLAIKSDSDEPQSRLKGDA